MDNGIIPIRLGITTCYVLVSKHGHILVDTGFRHFASLFEERLRVNGIRFEDFRYILLTHHHQDHAGLLGYLIDRNPSVRIIMHEKCVPLVEQGTNLITERTIFSTRRIGVLYGLAKQMVRRFDTRCPYTVRNDDIVVRGETWVLPKDSGIDGIVLHTPGHTDDSLSLIVEQTGVFCGDLAVNSYAVTGNHNLPILLEDLDELYASWKKIMRTDAQVIYPAHGRPFPIDLLRRNLDSHCRKKHIKVTSG